MYEPAEDSFLFVEFLNEYLRNKKNLKILDMGCGSCILSETCCNFSERDNILCVDIQEECVDLAKRKGFRYIKSNLFNEIVKTEKFDLILFNAPYLSENKLEEEKSKIETTGGKRGDEVCLRFLKQSKNYLKKNGKILLLISSLTPLTKIKKYNFKIVKRKKIWFEKLIILEFEKENLTDDK